MLTARSALVQRPLTARGGAPSRPRLTGHVNIFRCAPASSQHTPAIGRPFYGRFYEKDRLHRALKQQPRHIILLLGPPNCGKTALLNDFCQGKRHMVYLDCRNMSASDPSAFITALIKQLIPKAPQNLQLRLAGLAREVLSGTTVSNQGWMSLGFGLGQPGADATLNKVFATLNEIFEVWKEEAQQNATGTYGPVLVIDEANALMSWADKHPEKLHDLLQYFVRITKQEQQCHVVMATAEFGYQTWLHEAIGQGRLRPEVIGDFMESEARDFLLQQLGGVSSSDGKSIDDKAWAAVYEVCGGNAGALCSLAGRLRENPGCDWEEALRELWQVELRRVKRLSRGGEGFTAVHYAAAALHLLDRQQAHNTVGEEDMQELLGRYVEGAASEEDASAAGAAVLERMEQANALSVRPPSDWARDIPEEAFGDGQSLVTAPSTMDLYCMRRIRPRLEKVLKEHDSAQQANPPQGRREPIQLASRWSSW